MKIQVIVKTTGDGVAFSFDPANRESKRARDIANNVAQISMGRIEAFDAKDSKITIPGTRYVDFLIPGLLAFSILSSSRNAAFPILGYPKNHKLESPSIARGSVTHSESLEIVPCCSQHHSYRLHWNL